MSNTLIPSSSLRLVLCALAGVTAAASAADLWWDGGAADIPGVGNAASTGGAGTWNTSLLNWDQGAGLAHVAWDNSGNDTAIFGGTAGAVTLGTAISVNSLQFGSGTYQLSSATNALTLSGTAPSLFTSGTTQISAQIIGSNGLAKSGNGLLTIQTGGGNANFTGGLTINQGIVELNLNNMGTPVDMIAASNTLTLHSGTNLRIRAKTGVTSSQTLGAVTLSGATGLNITHQSGDNTISTLTLGAITRNAGSTLSFTTPTNGTSGDFYVPVATDLGNWAIISSPSGGIGGAAAAPIRYATVDGTGKVVAVTGTAAADASALTDTTGTINYDLALASGTAPATVSANSIRYSGAAGTTTPGTSFTVNSLMNGGQGTGTGLWTIGATANAGTIAIGESNELVIHPGENGMTINSKITGAGAGLTVNSYYNGKGTGAVTLGGTNDYTGKTIVNGSNSFSTNGHVVGNTFADAGSAFGAGGELILNGATIRTAPTSAQTTNRDMTWNGNSGIYISNSNPAQTVTFSGNISGSGTFNVDQNATSGALILSGNNDYSGEIQFQTDGKLIIAGANALKNATLNYAGQRVTATFSGNHAFNIGGLKGRGGDINLGSATGGGGNGMVSIGSNNQSNEFYGSLSGAAGLIKEGTGTQTLLKTTYSGNTVVSEGTLKLGSVSQVAFTANQATTTTTIDGVSRTQIRLTGSNLPGFAAGQTIKISEQDDRTIWGVGFDGGNTFLYLTDATLPSATYSGTAEALNGSIASTTIEVKSGAYLDVSSVSGFALGAGQTLAGAGTVTGDITVAGTLSPGNSPGTLNTDSQIWLDGGNYNWQLHDAAGAAGADYDTIAINGTLDLGDLTADGFNINLWTLAGISPDLGGNALNFDMTGDHSWTLVSTTGGITGFDADNFRIWTDANNGTDGFSNTLDGGFVVRLEGNNNLMLDYVRAGAVPEPGVSLLGGLGLLVLLRRRAR